MGLAGKPVGVGLRRSGEKFGGGLGVVVWQDVTGPEPNSTLESRPSPVRVRHLSSAGHNDLTAPFSQLS